MEYGDLIFNTIVSLTIIIFLTFIINELLLLWKNQKRKD